MSALVDFLKNLFNPPIFPKITVPLDLEGPPVFAASVAPHESAYSAGVWGIDVSKWQGLIDYRAAWNEGIRFVIAKGCEGNRYYDPLFQANYENALAAGMYFFAYMFLRPAYKIEDHKFTLTKAIGDKKISGVMLDCEVTDGMNPQICTDLIWGMAKFIQPAWEHNIIYSRASWWNPNVKRSSNWAKLCAVDTAHWGVPVEKVSTPVDWKTWDIWQAGIVNNRFGVKGDVDFCVWREDRFPGNNPLPPPPPPVKDFFDLTGKTNAGESFAGRITKV